ncbi:unnamed protein product [Linum trigynum]|uniref:Uncharacterized protein n=1 Tax=Linum trigynum TaxID=586398 RepID=A0AAV2CRJ4_9ROSI
MMVATIQAFPNLFTTEIGRCTPNAISPVPAEAGRHCFPPLTTKASGPLPMNSATAGRQRLPLLNTKP